eukprot:TRINITY_DN6306_c0_g1_i1.p1 TRINITY_DN6306_c0_g1~~TRINITY_DN6306_c0_g1_i1.p1  ORF type:complete len:757 (+),score=97.44 TRINITY_DN6306_c0_g1_i1:75-2273(+)
MAETSILQLLQERFQAINQAIGAQYEMLQTEALAWHQKCEALRRENEDLKAAWAAPDSLCSPRHGGLGPTDKESPDADFTKVVPDSPTPAWIEAKPHDKDDEDGSIVTERGNWQRLSSIETSSQHPAAPQDISPTSICNSYQRSASSSVVVRPTIKRSVAIHDMDDEALLNFAPREHFFEDRALRTGFKKGRTAEVDNMLSSRTDSRRRKSSEPRLTWQERIVISPGSVNNLVWECLGFLIVLFDFVVVPLQLLDDADVMPAAVDVVIHLMRVYWTLDIPMNFITGYFDPKSGKPEMSLKKIALRYATTVLTFDVTMIVADWTVFSLGQGAEAGQVLRFLRLARLLRLPRLLQRAQKLFAFITFRVRSDNLLLRIELCKVLVFCLAWIHPTACGFYAVGRSDKSGWVNYYNVNDGDLWSRYITSCHWSLSQLTGDSGHVPQTDMERTYATIALILAFLVSTLIVSNLTTIMTQSQLTVAEKSRQLITLKMFLSDNNVARQLATRIVEYATNGIEEQRRSPPEGIVDLLQELSTPLLTELHYDIYAAVLRTHPFFLGYDRANQRAMRAVCHSAVMKCKTAPGDVLFSSGECQANPQMYMLLKGELHYQLHDTERYLETGDCVNEATLWTHWPLQLGTLRAAAEAQVLCIQSLPFGHACKQYQTEHFYPAKYAQQFVTELNGAGGIDVSETFEFIDVHSLAIEVFGSFLGRSGAALSLRRYGSAGNVLSWKPRW